MYALCLRMSLLGHQTHNLYFFTGATVHLRQPKQLNNSKHTGDHYKGFRGRERDGGGGGFKAGQTRYTNY
jgi:hypothetical protein